MKHDWQLREKNIKKVLYITFFLNIAVAVLKIVVGKSYNYLSVTSSGLESLFDGSANILGLFSIHFANVPPDKDHPYGHQKYENLGSLMIAVLLLFSSYQIGLDLIRFFNSNGSEVVFGKIPILTVLSSMAVSWCVSTYEKNQGNVLNSEILRADASHTFGDFLISGGVLASIFLSSFGWTWPDFVVGLSICLYLIFLATRIVRQNLPDLVDAAPIIQDELIKKVEEIPEVRDIHHFRARGNSNQLYVDFHLLLNEDLSLKEAHAIGHQAEKMIKQLILNLSRNVDVTVHIEPYEKDHED